jgi:hydroxypyruvate isomerase
VQIADAPGRHEPGTGELPIDRYLERIAATGYDGWVGLEYSPSGASEDSFDLLRASDGARPADRPWRGTTPTHSERRIRT